MVDQEEIAGPKVLNPITLMATGNFCPPPMIFENVPLFPSNLTPLDIKEK